MTPSIAQTPQTNEYPDFEALADKAVDLLSKSALRAAASLKEEVAELRAKLKELGDG